MSKPQQSVSKSNVFVLLCLLIGCVTSTNLLNQRNLGASQSQLIATSSPASYDWRDHTSMTPVRDQKDCNAYYAFSTIAFLEQDLIINEKASPSIDLSEQYLTSCLPTGGCVGGNPKDAMQLVIKKGGVPAESFAAFDPWAVQREDICYPQDLIPIGDRPMISFYNVDDQQFLKNLLLKEPLNIYICSEDLKLYGPKSNSDRTLYCNANNIYQDHTVLLVGYTETEWIIKNSWGTNWGIGGYGYISRNADNDCCIGSQVFLRGQKSEIKECQIENCQTCVQNGYCSKCKPGFYVSSNDEKHTCVECNYSNCAECENNLGYCKTCIYGYALFFPEKVCKPSSIQNCKNVVNGGCKQCHNGFRVTADYKCERECAIQNCQTCKDDKSCSKCQNGYDLIYQNGTLSCQKNTCKTPHCAACDNKGKCLSCIGSFTIQQDSCVMKCNKQNCKECSQTKDICKTCNDGYALDFYSHECVPTKVSNCVQTYLTKYCSICKQGYQRSDSWENCNKICNIDNCKACQNGISNKCITCQQGYGLKVPEKQSIAICQKNKCELQNCTLCNSGSDTCLQCVDKYHVWSASAKACVPYTCHLQNCNKCKTDSTTCEQCKSGMVPFFTTGGCMDPTFENCVGVGQSLKGLECWDCANGFDIDYTTWTKCTRICNDKNCIDCVDSASNCKKCLDGYGLKQISDNQSKCIKIPVYLPNCLRGNSDQTICYECKQFYHFNNKTISCQLNENCPKNCIKCSGTGQQAKCECRDGMVWDFISKSCVINPSDAQCLVISNLTGTQQCFQCKDGFTLTDDGTGCEPDCGVENCDTCIHSDSENYPDYCQQCIIGYIATPNLTKCVPCEVENCANCYSYEQRKVCQDCKVGYELKGDGTCEQVKCQDNAVFNGLECACMKSYYKVQDTQQCKSCGTACNRCNSPQNCLGCQQGFYLKDGKCSPCFANCESCKDSNTCNTCQQGFTYIQKGKQFSCVESGLGNQGYTFLEDGRRVRCLAGCASCPLDYQVCTDCLDGYILKDDRCLKCQQNCKTCYPHILDACKQCEIGFSLVEGKCIRCKSTQCVDCSTTTDICVECIPGFYVKDQTCKSCGLGCKSCNKDGKCQQCHTGFALLAQGSCEQCLDGCSKCNPNSLHICQDGCLSGNYLKSGKCQNCPAECKTCESDKQCTQCVTGYDLYQGACIKWCEDSHCFDCTDKNNVCKECFAGYKLSKGKCVEDLSCLSLEGDNADNSTDQEPVQPKEDTICEVCPDNYYIGQQGLCEMCFTQDQNCIACQPQNPTNCTQCAKNYYISQGQCRQCAQNCETCRSQQYCYLCAAGHYMVQQDKEYTGNCAKCDDNCLTCVDEPTKCLTCKPGYVLSVAKICMNTDAIKFIIRLNLPFTQYSQKKRVFRTGFGQLFGREGTYHTQFTKVSQGSTITDGYVAIPADQNNKGDTYKTLKQNVWAGKRIGGIQVLSVSLVYENDNYNSDGSGDDEGVEGWIIAVAVVGGIVGLILAIIIITCICKKVKSKKQDYSESEENGLQSSGKNTESQFRKENPELKV